MASEVDICNLALGNIKAGSINSLDDATAEGRACKLRYPHARNVVMESAWWHFAGKTATLSQLSAEPEEWEYQYSIPSDFMFARYLIPGSKIRYHAERIEYEMGIDSNGNRVIMTNLLQAKLRYTFKQTKTTDFTNLFIEALSWYLAASLSIHVVGGKSGRELRKDALDMYQASLGSAIAAAESEVYPGNEHRDPDMIDARQSSGHIHDHRRPL